MYQPIARAGSRSAVLGYLSLFTSFARFFAALFRRFWSSLDLGRRLLLSSLQSHG
jgi:hypothetical protein